MTRLFIGLSFLLSLIETAPLLAQTTTGPAAQPRPAQPRPAQPQAGPARGVPAGPQPIRQAGATDPIAPPQQGQPLPAITPLVPAPQQPGWIPLDPEHEKWVNQILQYWENRSNKIKALSCDFTRWDYDPVFGPKDPSIPKTVAKGIIKYQQPDKGKFQVTELSQYVPSAKPGDKPQYAKVDASFAEHWICDGKQVFEFDARNKRVIQRELPPELQGKAIADGPLPFLFGARAETIRARYWVRGLPESGNGKYWLEAIPKSRQDVQNFKAVTIVLDEKTFLPEMLETLAPNYDAKTNPAKTTYQFTNHNVTDSSLTPQKIFENLNLFKTAFYAPATPGGWARVIERADGSTASPGVPGALEATRPMPPRSPSALPR